MANKSQFQAHRNKQQKSLETPICNEKKVKVKSQKYFTDLLVHGQNNKKKKTLRNRNHNEPQCDFCYLEWVTYITTNLLKTLQKATAEQINKFLRKMFLRISSAFCF